MATMKSSLQKPRFVLCVDNAGHAASLEPRKFYELLGEEASGKVRLLRVIDESGEDYLYPPELFCAVPLAPALEKRLRAAG